MMTNSDFSSLTSHIEKISGITLPESNYKQVKHYAEDYLSKNGCGLTSFISVIDNDPNEYDRFMQVVTINETYFFREEKQFLAIRDYIFPGFQVKNPGEQICIWSSSCSSGEEALSIYALAWDFFGTETRVKIYASDINQESLNLFKKGVYRKVSFRTDGRQFHDLIRRLASMRDDDLTVIAPERLDAITIKRKNLFEDKIDDLPQMDLVFLRNTLIYMNWDNKKLAIDSVAKKIKTGGFLALASSEAPFVSHPSLKVREIGGYYFLQKIDPQEINAKDFGQKIKEAKNNSASVDLKQSSPFSSAKTAGTKTKKIPKTTVKEEKLNEGSICEAVGYRLNNKLYPEHPPRLKAAADFILEIISRLNNGEFDSAEETLKPKIEEFPALGSHLMGYIHYHKDSMPLAETFFKQTLGINPGFWPSRYYKAKIADRGGQANVTELKRLVADIGKYIDAGRYDYQFLLDGFNARYFLMICRTMLDKEIAKTCNF